MPAQAPVAYVRRKEFSVETQLACFLLSLKSRLWKLDLRKSPAADKRDIAQMIESIEDLADQLEQSDLGPKTS